VLPGPAAPRTGVGEEQQPHQRGAPGLRRPPPAAAHGGCRAAPRPAARAQRRLRARNKAQGDDLGASWSRCTKNRGRRGAAAAPEGRTWPPTAPTCSAHGGSRAAPRPAVRAQRRRRARNIVQGAASGRAQCRCTNNQGQRGAAAAPEGRIWPTTAPALGCPRGLPCCSTPRCSCPAAPPCAEKAQGTALGDSRCRCTKNRGRSRSSSRTRGTHLASDGPHV